MANPRGFQTIVALQTQQATDLLLAPALNSDNVLQNQMGIYYVMTGVKDKRKMLHLSKPSNSLKPKSGCKKWDANVRYKLNADEITVCSFEVEGEMCADEFDAGCLRNLQGAGSLVNSMAVPGLDEMQMASLLLLREGLTDDIYKIAYFGDEDFQGDNYMFFGDFADMDSDNRAAMQRMLRHCNGWWKEIANRVNETDPDTKVAYVDSYDGTNKASDPTKVIAFLEQLYAAADPVLQYWNKSKPNSEWPVYLVDQDIYNAYIQYLRAHGDLQSYALIVNGTPVPNVYTFNGYPIMAVPEWRMFDAETKALNSDGTSKNLRAMFVAKEVLSVASDVSSAPSAVNGEGIIVQVSPSIKDKGAVATYMALKLGFGIAHNKLIVASWNSTEA